jgi:4-amino-4-deoxy-L-arabinose transferase-like glycosyltransferase
MTRETRISLWIVLIATLTFIPFLGFTRLFDWDEVNFAESAREMMVTGNYSRVQVNFQPFWEKPPLFFWLQALCMHLFGINEFAARFPNAICGIVTLLLLFRIGKEIHDERFGITWATAYFGSFLPHFYFKSGIIDPWFNLFIFLGIYYIFRATLLPIDADKQRRFRLFALSGLFIGLGILTKGPVAFLICSLVAVVFGTIALVKTKKLIVTVSEGAIYVVVAFLVSTLWYGYEVIKNGLWFVREFLAYQAGIFTQNIAGHEQPFYYHFFVLLLGVFPSSFLALASIRRDTFDSETQRTFKRWMVIFFFVPFIVFSISKTKIVHYSSLCYFGLTYLAADYAYRVIRGEAKWTNITTVLCLLFGAIVAGLLTWFPLAVEYGWLAELVKKDRLAVEILKADVKWSGYEFLVGVLYFGLLVIATVLLFRKKFQAGFATLFFSTALTMHLFTLAIAPKIDLYVQGGPVGFFEQLQNEDCYVEPLGYKSYAHLFYFRKKPPTNPKSSDLDWLLNGEIDKPAYFVSKITRADEFLKHPNLEVLKIEAGWVYFRRLPKQVQP